MDSVAAMRPSPKVLVSVRHYWQNDTALSICVYVYDDDIEAATCNVRGDVAEIWFCKGSPFDQVEAALIQKYGDLYRSAKRESKPFAGEPEPR